MSLTQTTTLQEVMDWCSTHTSLQNYFRVGGQQNQPAVDIGNSVIQSLLAKACPLMPKPASMPWKFNRKVLDGTNGNFLVSQYGQQDIRFAGASAFTLQNSNNGASSFGGVGVDMTYSPARGGVAGITVSGGICTVQTIDPHPCQAGQTVFISGAMDSVFNSVFTFSSLNRTSAWTGGFTVLTAPDQFHFTFTAPANTSATVTNIAITGNVLTVTAANGFKTGQVATFTSVVTNTFLNAQQITILSASGTQFTASFKHADVVSGADTGTVTICSGAPGFGTIAPANSDPNLLGTVIGLPAWGWGESASLQDINSTAFPQPVTCNLEFVRELPPSYMQSNEKLSICMLQDEGNGVLRFRMSQPGGDYNFQLNCAYQQKAPKLTTPQSIFAWPDDQGYVLREVALHYAYRFAKGVSAAESQAQLQLARIAVLSAYAGEDSEASAYGPVPSMPLMR